MKYSVTMLVRDDKKTIMWVDKIANDVKVIPFKESKNADVYVDVFGTLEEANDFYTENTEFNEKDVITVKCEGSYKMKNGDVVEVETV